EPRPLRLGGQRCTVGVQAVEEKRCERQLAPQHVNVEPSAETAHRFLKRKRSAAGTEREHLSVENQLARGETSGGFDHFRYCGCDIPQTARKYFHVIARLVHLNARAIELEFERGFAEQLNGLGGAFSRRR